ncbi:16S rRNA methyltransferase, partial [Neisseria meningitidis]
MRASSVQPWDWRKASAASSPASPCLWFRRIIGLTFIMSVFQTAFFMFQKHLQKASDSVVGGTLYVVATPIGNLADITLRALAVLQKADIICAEDTRVTAQLLSAYGIQGKLVSVREHNERQMADKI